MKKNITILLVCFVSMFLGISSIEAATVNNPVFSFSVVHSETGTLIPGIDFVMCDNPEGEGCNIVYTSKTTALVVNNIAETQSGIRYIVSTGATYGTGCADFEPVKFEIPADASGKVITVKIPVSPLEGQECKGIDYEANPKKSYKVRFVDSKGNAVEGVKYSIWQDNWFPDCSRTPQDVDVISTKEGYRREFKVGEGQHYWIKTSSVPEGYHDYKCTLINYPEDSEYIDIALNSISEGEQPDKVPVSFVFGNSERISGVKYELYNNSDCLGNPYLVKTTTAEVEVGYSNTIFLPVGNWSYKVVEVPEGYMKISCQKFKVELDTSSDKFDPNNPNDPYDAYNPMVIMKPLLTGSGIWNGKFDDNFDSNITPDIPGDNDDNSGDSNNEANTISGSIKLSVTSDSKLSDVRIKICKTEDCKNAGDVIFSDKYSNMDKIKIAFGTYYLVVDEVPESYVKPKTQKIILDKENPDFVYTLKISTKVPVPDTSLNASKIFAIAGIIGILAGILLLYFNNQKKEA